MDEQKKQELIKRAWDVDSDSELSLFISSYKDPDDATIVAILCAWVSNGLEGEEIAVERFIQREMDDYPTTAIRTRYTQEKVANRGIESFWGTLTYEHLFNLLSEIASILDGGNSIYEYYEHATKRKRCKYAHDALAMILGHNNGFPTRKSNCSFYRYNLLFYWLTYKLHIWDVPTSKALLPCNDRIYENAYKLGITKYKKKNNLENAVELTAIAREWFGDEHFYKLYELLNFYE